MAATLTKTGAASKGESATTLLLIALFKLLKGVLLLIVAVGALRMLHRDISSAVMHWVDLLRVDPENRFIHTIIVKSFGIGEKQLKEISAGTFFYAAILLTEGVGLLMKKHWAEWFTVISTAVFIPFEIYEMIHRFTPMRVGIFLLNIAIVWYLVNRIRQHK